MQTLEWTDALALELPLMDDTHREFVALLSRVGSAEDRLLPGLWRELIEHTDQHFGQEDRWMNATGFASSNCHSTQHRVVLQVLHDAAAAVQEDAAKLPILRRLCDELAIWFPQHTQSMDAALALHLRSVGFDPITGTVTSPDALPKERIESCGSSTCSDNVAEEVSTTATA